MQALIALCLLCLAMFLGSFLAGLVPLMLSRVQSRHLKWMSAFGAGMLLSTTTEIIVPEAFSSCRNETPKPMDGGAAQRWTDNSKRDCYRGLLFTLGFLFMFIIDNVPGLLSASRFRNQWVTTLGLCIHSAADGFVVAVATLQEDHVFRSVVFLAVAIHKAPAAFGLVSFLLEQDNVAVQLVKRHLFIFSLSSPVSAMVCYLIFKNIDSSGGKSFGTGLPMLFSAGTFLYISTTHVIPELRGRMEESSALSALSFSQMACFLLGCFVPFLVNFAHVHG